MAKLKGCKIAQQGHTGGEDNVYDATAAITAPETTSQYSRIPTSLKAKRIWLPFKTSPRPAGGVNKIPHNRQGRPAKYTDPSTWMSYEEAVLQRLRPGYAGIGLVFSEELGMLGSDFDHCIVDGVLDPEVEGWVAKLNTYTELSFSGEGLHSLAYGKLPWKANRSGKAEMYTDARFFVVTGRQMTGTPSDIRPAQDAINAIHQEVFGNQPDRPWDTTAHTPYTGEEGGGGNKAGGKSLYPDWQVKGALLHNSRDAAVFLGRTVLGPSEADFKLGCILAFYCNGDLDQMRRLFLQSGLVREKTTSARKGAPGDYLGLTLWNALRIYRIKHGEKHWIAAPRKPKAPRGGTDGRPLSGATQKIVNLHSEQPELTFRAISVALSIPLETVRKAIQRHGNTPASSPPNVRTVRSCVTLPPEEEQPDVEDAREELMSCPRRYREDYAKPKGWVEIPFKPILADGVTYESIHVISARSHAAKVYIRPHIQLPLNMRGIVRRSLAVAA